MTVVDASVTVALFLGGDDEAEWATAVHGDTLDAPHSWEAEVGNQLRRGVLRGLFDAATAQQIARRVAELDVVLHPFAPLRHRIWSLHPNVTTYDAWYVALAESLAVPLATTDLRLASSTGPRCEFLTPP